MDAGDKRTRSGLHNVALRAFDMSERSARAGLESHRRRVQRWRSRLFMITQIAVAAGFSWIVAQHLLGHRMPFFSSVSTIICLGFSFGQRVGRVMELSVGVALGVLTGDIFVRIFGTGPWQIALVCFVAMSVATWLGARTLMVTQAGIQAATVLTLMPDPTAGMNRWLDAVVGCGVALLFTLIAPTSPVQKPRIQAAQVLSDAAATLHDAQTALLTDDQAAADLVLDRARKTETSLAELSNAAAEGVSVVRYSPFMRKQRLVALKLADLVAPLDRLARNLRVLARRTTIAVWRDEVVPRPYVDLIGDVAGVIDECAAEMFARRTPDRVRDRIVATAASSSRLETHEASMSAVVILAQLRSMLVDLMELTGLDYPTARAMVPEME